jgi:LCP family protein required for cell wall assembly
MSETNIKKSNQLKLLKLVVYAIAVGFMITATSFAFVLKSQTEESLRSALKISTLINEVGALKAENEAIIGSSNLGRDDIMDISYALAKLKTELKELNEKLAETEEEKNNAISSLEQELSEKESGLLKVIRDKEETIAGLNAANLKLQNELSLPEYGDEIKSYLILGQNAGLMDTIIITTVNPQKKEIVLVSIPRDLQYNGRKINSLYNLYGIESLKEAVSEITNLKIENYVIFDFQSFTRLVDFLGGIKINVGKNLQDYSYPGPNNSYIKVSFEKGEQMMDGETALKYARSRKSTSDFDRSKRQHQVIEAVKIKALEIDLLTQLHLATKLFAMIKDDIKTDANLFDAMALMNEYKSFDINGGNIIDTSNFLYSTRNLKGEYIVLPKDKTYMAIKQYIGSLLK